MLEARGSVMRDLGEDPAGGLEWQDPVSRWRRHSERPRGSGGGIMTRDVGDGRPAVCPEILDYRGGAGPLVRL